mgnify:CR=1 FL=1
MILTVALCFAQPVPADAPPVTAEMHQRFQTVMRIREHVIQGKLDEAKKLAPAIVDAEPPAGTPASWKQWTEQLYDEAVKLEAAKDLPTAAMAVTRVAATCADCHVAHDGGPGLERMRSIPPQKWSAGDNMPLHQWAVDWMWLGLTAPSEASWHRGATELRSEPLAKAFDDNPTAKVLEARLYDLAKEAVALEEERRGERTRVMGDMLAICAACHVLWDAGVVEMPE